MKGAIKNELLISRLQRIARVFPYRDQTAASFMYARPADRSKRGTKAVVYSILDAADGRAMLHELVLVKPQFKDMSMIEWAGWIQVHVPGVLRTTILAHYNRNFGSVWRVRGIVGWHYLKED